ncbi:GNAT family N-acetyltransferase [Palleronia sp. KMU-117]|uniref:GNAT family N-acetyltransferase n=1 Tax=Palleronia sp. KMU-117 TaxID=3434108 RepID=UPI003D73E211
MTVVYRLAATDDTPTVAELLHEMAAEAGRAIAVTGALLRDHGFGPDPRFRVILAEAEGEVLGLALVFPEYSSWRGAVGLYVQDLYVRPGARGRGIAQALLTAAWDSASDWAPSYLTLMVDHRNDTASAWYERQGFGLRERGDLLILDGPALARLMEGPDR